MDKTVSIHTVLYKYIILRRNQKMRNNLNTKAEIVEAIKNELKAIEIRRRFMEDEYFTKQENDYISLINRRHTMGLKAFRNAYEEISIRKKEGIEVVLQDGTKAFIEIVSCWDAVAHGGADLRKATEYIEDATINAYCLVTGKKEKEVRDLIDYLGDNNKVAGRDVSYYLMQVVEQIPADVSEDLFKLMQFQYQELADFYRIMNQFQPFVIYGKNL